jgi:hypothetical protein
VLPLHLGVAALAEREDRAQSADAVPMKREREIIDVL